MSRRAYLLCFFDPQTGHPARYKHAGHYLGDTDEERDEQARLTEHREGRGSVLTAAARRAGLDFRITRTWPGGADKARQLKSRSGASYCPDCSDHPLPGVQPRQPGAKYLTRRMREAAQLARQIREATEDACRQAGAYAYPWPGQPFPACPGCEREGAHTAECDERERAVARFLADIGVEPRKETGMASNEPDPPVTAAEYEAIREAMEDGLPTPDIYDAGDMRIWREEHATATAEPEGPLTGPGLDDEIGRLAELYPEPEYSAKEMADRAAEEEADYAYDELAEQLADAREADARHAEPYLPQSRAEEVAEKRAAGWYDQVDPGPAPDHLYGGPECAEADPETEHFGWPQPEPEDAGRFPLPRVLDAAEVSPAPAPVAAELPDGTPHADSFLASRGWQAERGLYVRQPQAQLEAG